MRRDLEVLLIQVETCCTIRIYKIVGAMFNAFAATAPHLAESGEHTDVVHLALMYMLDRIYNKAAFNWSAFYRLWTDSLAGRDGCHPALVEQAKSLLADFENVDMRLYPVSLSYSQSTDLKIGWFDKTYGVDKALYRIEPVYVEPGSPTSDGFCSFSEEESSSDSDSCVSSLSGSGVGGDVESD